MVRPSGGQCCSVCAGFVLQSASCWCLLVLDGSCGSNSLRLLCSVASNFFALRAKSVSPSLLYISHCCCSFAGVLCKLL